MLNFSFMLYLLNLCIKFSIKWCAHDFPMEINNYLADFLFFIIKITWETFYCKHVIKSKIITWFKVFYFIKLINLILYFKLIILLIC